MTSLSCCICNRSGFVDPAALESHIRRDLVYPTIGCEDCPTAFTGYAEFERHCYDCPGHIDIRPLGPQNEQLDWFVHLAARPGSDYRTLELTASLARQLSKTGGNGALTSHQRNALHFAQRHLHDQLQRHAAVSPPISSTSNSLAGEVCDDASLLDFIEMCPFCEQVVEPSNIQLHIRRDLMYPSLQCGECATAFLDYSDFGEHALDTGHFSVQKFKSGFPKLDLWIHLVTQQRLRNHPASTANSNTSAPHVYHNDGSNSGEAFEPQCQLVRELTAQLCADLRLTARQREIVRRTTQPVILTVRSRTPVHSLSSPPSLTPEEQFRQRVRTPFLDFRAGELEEEAEEN